MRNPWAEIEKPSSEFNARLVAEKHPLKLYWALDARGRYLFLADVPRAALPAQKALPKLTGILVGTAVENVRGKLVLLLNEKANWELFHTLCADLVRSTAVIQNEDAGTAIILRRLRRWQEFLKRARPRLLSLEEIKGLIGELLFLRDTVAARFGWDEAILSWKGPEDAPQDFAVHDTAIEVKSQSGSSKPTVRIGSIEQLNPQLPKGYLVVFTLATADPANDGAFTLNSLTESIRSQLGNCSDATQERFEDLLFLSGYVPSDSYDDHVFQRVAMRAFRITDGFPRIAHAAVPEGVEQVAHHLRIEACAPFEAQLEL